jgi:phosphoglycolate phosphatase-like HAD superfamily hydrolase
VLKAVVFDYNGTLVDDLHLHVEAYYESGRRMGFDVAREDIERHISQPPSKKRLLFYGAISDPRWNEMVALRKRIYLEMAGEPQALLFPDTAGALGLLARRFRIGILSNTFRDLFERVFPPVLSGLMAATLFFDEVPEPKPSPAPLLTLLERLGVAPLACGYVGDALEDIQMARAAGARAFAVATGTCPAAALSAAGAEWVGGSLSALAAHLLADPNEQTA